MALVLFLLFLVLPFVEIVLIIQIGSTIGVGPTLAIMVLSAVLGSWLCKREGLGVLRRLNESLDEGRIPTTELADGALILLAGALMVTPGFITDVTGLLLLIPPTRALVRTAVVARFRHRIERSGAGAGPAGFTFIRMGGGAPGAGPFGPGPFGPGGPTGPRRGPGGDDVIDAESWEDPVPDDRFGQLPGAR